MGSSRVPLLSTIANIALILFFVGLFAFAVLGGSIVARTAMEQLELKVVLADFVSEDEGRKLQKELSQKVYVRSARYISKNEARASFSAAGEDFLTESEMTVPLPATIHLSLKHMYIDQDSVERINKELLQNPQITEIYYPVKLIKQVDDNVDRLLPAVAGIGLALLAAAFFLILNTVRLAIHARRFAIRTMWLVGATPAYVRAPFLRLGTLQGLVGGTIASGLLILLISALEKFTGLDFSLVAFHPHSLALYALLALFGGVLGYLSSYVAVNKYLGKTLDQIA
ncbi:MAG: permease-like cell division protein FtsX [Bacteroidia bacterium]|nr:permease-like cell division protein FtsX [Bacteroidia bacterium]MDW8334222.1 permease-like cell division protein FtsX [Bacteroidia bacterium]